MADTLDPAAQFHTRGYLIDEDSELGLRDLILAKEQIADMFDLDGSGTGEYDITGEGVAAILRSFAHLERHLILPAPFAYAASVRGRAG